MSARVIFAKSARPGRCAGQWTYAAKITPNGQMGMQKQEGNQSVGGHHLVLGRLDDILTGETLDDTLDERYRQKLARFLLEVKGFDRVEITPRNRLQIRAGAKAALVVVDFKITLADRVGMIIKFGPGSIVTRQRPALAASRLIAPYQVPVVVVTNGETATVLDGATGAETGGGLASIPTRSTLRDTLKTAALQRLPAMRLEMEARILYAYEVDGSCPCDETVCRL
jgi:hypothetical protein